MTVETSLRIRQENNILGLAICLTSQPGTHVQIFAPDYTDDRVQLLFQGAATYPLYFKGGGGGVRGV